MRSGLVRSPFTWTICFGLALLVAAVLVPRALAAQYDWYTVPGQPQSGPVSCYTDQVNYFRCQIGVGGVIRTHVIDYRNFTDAGWRYTPNTYPYQYWTYGSAIYTNNAGTWVERQDASSAYTADVRLGSRDNVKAMCGLLLTNSHWNDFTCTTTKADNSQSN